MKMECHTEHHMFPNIPFHALPKLYEKMKRDLPETYKSMWEVFGELFPVMWKQRTDVNCVIKHQLPG